VIKLPDSPEDRKKAFVAIGVVGAGVAYALFTFGIQPYFASVQTRRARVTELQALIDKGQQDANTTERNRKQNAAIIEELLAASEKYNYILRPSLGNYLLVATEIINTTADGLKLSIDNISEVPRPAVAAPVKKKSENKEEQDKQSAYEPKFLSYTVNVSLNSGAHALAQFLNRLESSNPYVTISRLVIMEQSDKDPDKHFVSLHIQWAIWQDEDYPRRLAAELIADEDNQ